MHLLQNSMGGILSSSSEYLLSYFQEKNVSREDVISYFQQKAELKCDPIYLAVICANVYLRYQKLFQQYKEDAERLAKENKSITPFGSIKISFKEDSTLKITEPSYTQGVLRKISREGRAELGLIRPHLVKLLRWVDCKDPTYQTILKMFKLGIECILKGYKYQQSQEIMISQTITLKENKEVQTQTITIQTNALETDFVVRILENDIDLLEEAIEEKDERQQLEFTNKLAREEVKYFHFHRLKLIQVAKTIDEYMAKQVRERWDEKTLTSIVNHLTAKNNSIFDHSAAIDALLFDNPPGHQALKLEVRQMLADTLLKCTVKGKEEAKDKAIDLTSPSPSDESKKSES